MDLAIRAANAADIGAVAAIYADAVVTGTATYELDPPTSEVMMERFVGLQSRSYPYIVAVLDGVVAGYAYAGPFRDRPAYRFIVEDSIYIAPRAKGRGLGRLLLEQLVADAQQLGFRQMIAVIGDGSPSSPSVRLHEKLGFLHSGTISGSGYKHQRWLDTVFMQLEMNGGVRRPPDPNSLPERSYRRQISGSGLDQL